MTLTITEETRNASFAKIKSNLGDRQQLVFTNLYDLQGNGGMTANELAMQMWKDSKLVTPDRNNVHPRLNELVDMGIVQVIGKRLCTISGKKCGVYKTNFGVVN